MDTETHIRIEELRVKAEKIRGEIKTILDENTGKNYKQGEDEQHIDSLNDALRSASDLRFNLADARETSRVVTGA